MSHPSGTDGWDQLARAAARGDARGAEPGALLQLLSFELGGALYGIPVERIREIVRIRPMTPVPRLPDPIRGIISLRGEIVQVIDLRRRLKLGASEPSRKGRIIVIQDGNARVAGMLVDAVREVLRVPEESLRPAPPGESGTVEALCVDGDRFVSLLDLDRMLEIDAG